MQQEESKKELVGGLRSLVSLGIDTLLSINGVPFPIATGMNTIGDMMAGFANRKLSEFSKPLADIDPAKIDEFKQREFKTVDELKEFWEKEILDLSKLDDDRKARIKGHLLKAVIEGNIKVSDYRKMCRALEQMLMDELQGFYERYLHHVDINAYTDLQEKLRVQQRLPFDAPTELSVQLGLLDQKTEQKETTQARVSASAKKITSARDIMSQVELKTTHRVMTIGRQLIVHGLKPVFDM